MWEDGESKEFVVVMMESEGMRRMCRERIGGTKEGGEGKGGER